MATVKLKVGGVLLPSPTSVNITDEILWSESTGRSKNTGTMLGAVIATKHTLDVEWQWLTTTEWQTIRDALPEGFFKNVEYISNSDSSIVTMNDAYRSSITREEGGYKGGTRFYKSIKVQIIEK